MKKHLLLALLIAVTSGLTLNAQPELYGLAQQGGSSGYGTLFKYDATSGVLDVKHNFNYADGAYPVGKLLHASNDKFYGTTNQAGPTGYGTIFEYDPDAGTFTTKLSLDYSTGAYGHGHMIQLENDDIIGTSTSGGTYGYGTLWKYDIATNTITKLKDFDYNTTGAYPYNGVTQASNGKLYGLTWYGGPGSHGTLYELDPLTNVFTVIRAFSYDSNGAFGVGKLLEFDGHLYGVTYQGGTYGYGTIFKYDFNASVFASVYSFNYSSGSYPYVGLNEAGGKLYGTTLNGGPNNAGTIYSFDPQTGNVSHFHGFDYNSGAYPYNALTLASDGNLYGMTQSGGNQGTIYKYDLGSGTHTIVRVLDNSTGIHPFWTELTDPEVSVPAICKPLKIQKAQTNILCNGLSDGAIDITVTGATSPNYSFLWSNGATTEDISNLPAGNYSVEVTVNDANGCHKRAFVNVTQPTPLSAGASAKKVSFNGTSDGAVNLSVTGGTEPYSYAWSNGATTEDLTGVGVGVYSVQITDAYGCLQTASAEVTKRLTAQTDLYGVAQSGGTFGAGTIFKLDYSSNSVVTEHSFEYSTDGANPIGKLLYADNGLLYGTTVSGGNQGYGTLFEYDPSTGIFTTRLAFDYSSTGVNPYGQLVQTANGDIFGTCVSGGTSGYGTIWKYDIVTNTATVVQAFDYNNSGAHPHSGVMLASNGKLYGLTHQGGSTSYGTLYEFDPQTNVFTVKQGFNYSNGAYNVSKMVEGNGKLYGTSYQGGTNGYGTIFEYNLATEALTTMFNFDYSTNGGYPYVSMTLASDGLLYGSTTGGAQFSYGSLFSFDPHSGSFINLHHFNYNNEGYGYNPVMEASDGNLYGLLHAGASNAGSIYTFDRATSTFAIVHVLAPSNGQYPFWTELTELGDVVTDPCMADNTAPEVVTKDITVELDADGGVTIATGDIDDGSTDDCTIATYALDISSFDCTNLGPNTVTLTVTDAKGNAASATATVTVVDTTLPVFTGLFPDIVLSACVSTASWDEPVATDNCTVTVTRTGPASGSTFENGSSTTITYTATDASGNQATASFVVTRAEALASAASATQILCKGDASTVTVTASGGTAPYSGVGNFQVAAGTHTFTVNDGDGCSISTTITVNEPGALSAWIYTSNSYLYYGYTGDQSAVITATPAGGTAPYAVSITMVNGDGAGDTRVLLCNVNGGNESWTSGANTSSGVNACGVKPVSTSNANIGAGGSYSVNVSLMADARFVATITDANGCIYTIPYADGARVDAEDVRCFAGNSGEAKVRICHRTGSSKNPCVAICVSESQVADHIAHGDYYGSCTASCTAPVANARIAAPAGESGPDLDLVSDAYPNPFNTSLSVAVSNPDHGPVNMHMVDMIGRNLSLKVSTPSEEGVYLLETNHIQPGFYLLRVIIGDNYTRTIKLRKE